VGEADSPIRRGRIKAIFTPEAQRTQKNIGKGKAKEEKFIRIASGFNFWFQFFL